jgi:hypothetical protein
MPCCAFAAFILGQILIGFDAIKRFVLGRSASATDIAVNPATEWRLGSSRTVPPRKRDPHSLRWLAVAASLEAALMIGVGYGFRAHLTHDHASRSSTCRSPRLAQARVRFRLGE